MKTREQIYKNEFQSILRDLSTYRCVKKEQLIKLTTGKREIIEKLLTYMEYHRRIWRDGDYYYSYPDGWEPPDSSMIASLWVLIDFITAVDFHTVGEYPAKIVFFANEAVHEIVYVDTGKETLLSYLLNENRMKDSNVLVIVENKEQINMINAPNIKAYCTVSDDGDVLYYKKE